MKWENKFEIFLGNQVKTPKQIQVKMKGFLKALRVECPVYLSILLSAWREDHLQVGSEEF